MSKLMGFDFEIQYKEGCQNKAADALSCGHGAKLIPLRLSNAKEGLLEDMKAILSVDPVVHKLIAELKKDPQSHPKFTWSNHELRHRGKRVIGVVVDLKLTILLWLQNSAVGGHSGRDVTIARVKTLFFWKGMNKDIQQYIRNFDVCQRCKPDLAAYPNLL